MRQSYHIFRTWAFEIFSSILAVGLIAAIIGLLLKHNGEPPPNFGQRFNLNLNALLALLSTILRATLVVLVSSIICQQMWEWFSLGRTHPLSDIQRFDAGSRGIIGALQLLPTVVMKDLVTLVAIVVMLTSFLVGPFVQQASRGVECAFPIPGSNASLPFAHFVPRQGGYDRYPGNCCGYPLGDTVIAVLSTALAPEGVENRITPTCSTGNCTFENGDPHRTQQENISEAKISTHSTVGVCNTCNDASSLINVVNVTTEIGNYSSTDEEWMLPNEWSLSRDPQSTTPIWIKPTSDLKWLGNALAPDLRKNSRWAYANATVMSKVNGTTAIATVCTIYPCLRTYTASVKNGELSEVLIDSAPMQVNVTGGESGKFDATWIKEEFQVRNGRSLWYHDHVAIKSPCRVNEQIYDLYKTASEFPEAMTIDIGDFSSDPYTIRTLTVPDQCTYRQDASFVAAVSHVLTEGLFNASCTKYRQFTCSKPTTGLDEIDPLFSGLGPSTFLRTLYNDGATNLTHITRWFDSFSTALTNRFRFQYGVGTFNNSAVGTVELAPPPLGEVQGLVWQTTTCVSMQWEWLILPAALTLITVLLAVLTVFRSWQHRYTVPVWKDALLPFIFYSYRIESIKAGILPPLQPDRDAPASDNVSGTNAVSAPERLMEVSEMIEIGNRTPVIFQWPGQIAHEPAQHATTSIFTLERKSESWRRTLGAQGRDSEIELISTRY